MKPVARILGVLALAAVFAAPAGAPAAEGWGYEMWGELMSPYCPGRTLADCPSAQADQLRMWILMQEAAGRTRADVESELIERFGDDIRSTPKPEGFALTAYAVPVVLFLLGGAVVALFLRRQTQRPAGAAPPPPAALDPELERAIDDEFAR